MADIHPQRIRILGKRWTLATARLPGKDGLAENDPKTPQKHIWINQSTKGKDLLDVLIHEALHCAEPKWTEEVVTELATDLANMLWKLGYRSTELDGEDI